MGFELLYLGHSAFQLRTAAGTVVLIDPFISENRLCPLRIEELPPPHAVLVTHGAFDHLGDAFAIVARTGARLICAPEVRRAAIAKGIAEERVDLIVWGGAIQRCGLVIRAVENRHISHLLLEGSFLTGMPLSFILEVEPGLSIYHAGDTSLFSDLHLIGELYRPAVALVPVGAAPGFFPELLPREAARAVSWLRPDVAVPMHYQEKVDAQLFLTCVELLVPGTRAILLNPGEVLYFDRSVTAEIRPTRG